jgi:polysaccharide export outer membrane protein
MKQSKFSVWLVVFVTLITSCASNRMYKTDQKGDILTLVNVDTAFHQLIDSDDKITVSVWDNDDLSFGSVFNIYNANESFGKWILVGADGFVTLPKIGKVKIKGLTCPEAADFLAQKYEAFLVNPIVVVKVLNKEISVLGEVVAPGSYTMDKEVFTISELIAKAQGLDQFANPKKIQLIRNDTNYRINLAELSASKAYNIVVQPNDIIYVPAKGIKTVAENSPTLLPFASILTSVAVFLSIIN